MRSSSPEYDEVILTDNSEDEDEDEEQDDEELSEEIPIKVEHPKSLYQDLSNKDDDAIMFDDSDEFSLPQVDWTCIDSLSPGGNTDGVVPPVRDEEADAGEDGLVEPETSEQCKVTDSAVLNADYVNKCKDYQLDISEGVRSISQGLIFNVSSVDRPDSTLVREETESLQASPVLSMSRLSRKRSRMSRDECAEQVPSKRLHENDDDVLAASGSVAERMLPRPLHGDAGSDDARLLSSYNNSVSECNSPLPSTSCAAETTAISRGSSMPNMFSQDGNASFSQGM